MDTTQTRQTTARQPSPRALATRSLTAAMRLTGEARREALRQHATIVWPFMVCTHRDRGR